MLMVKQLSTPECVTDVWVTCGPAQGGGGEVALSMIYACTFYCALRSWCIPHWAHLLSRVSGGGNQRLEMSSHFPEVTEVVSEGAGLWPKLWSEARTQALGQCTAQPPADYRVKHNRE